MMQGRTLTELAAELERQVKTKRDFKAPTQLLEAVPVPSVILNNTVSKPKEERSGEIVLRMQKSDKESKHANNFHLTELCHDQLGEWAGIPHKYYERMRTESPDLLAKNLNFWLHKEKEVRLVRTLDGKARAFLSNRYRTLDNWDIADASLPILADNKLGIRVVSSEVTENRLYIKAVSERISINVKKGDIVQAGIVISNSEVGLGAVKIEPLTYRLACENGMILADSAVRKFHVGRQSEELEKAYEVFTDETRKADDRAFYLKLQDVVRAAFDEIRFKEIATRMQDSSARQLPEEANVQEVVEVVVDNYKLNRSHSRSIMQNLIRGGDLSQWGLANAVTAAANSQKDYEEATALERAGGAIIDMTPRAWQVLSEAAA